MKTAIIFSILVGTFTQLHAQEPIVPSHFNHNAVVHDSLKLANADNRFDDIAEPDYFKVDCHNAQPKDINQDNSKVNRINNLPVNTKNGITDR